MRIPQHWHRAHSTARIGELDFALYKWGWSDVSKDEARRHAEERLAATATALRHPEHPGKQKDRYDYHADPLREERLEVVGDPAHPRALITRNGYGARVLNTARVFFADVDVPEGGGGWRLFRRRKSPFDEAVARIEEWVERNPWAGFRIYRTPAGLRLLATDRTRDPAGGESDALLEALQSDPLYRRLCRAQACYRARLSAKPWRIGLVRSPVRFPDEGTRERQQRWCEVYEKAASDHAACRFLRHIGRDAKDAEIEEVIALHDAHSGALGARPLA